MRSTCRRSAPLGTRKRPVVGPSPRAPSGPRRGCASTDFGNVSQVLPSFAISFAVSETPVAAHTSGMTRAATTELAHRNAIATGGTLALIAAQLRERPELLDAARAEFAARTGRKEA